MRFAQASLILLLSAFAMAGPKYGPNASPLSKRTNLEYFKKNPAPDFWALMPFYVGQNLGQQCSAATITMVLNAARTGMALTSDDRNVTIQSLLEQYSDDRYNKFMSTKIDLKSIVLKNFDRSNVGNKRLAEVLRIALKKLGLETPKTKVEIINVDLNKKEAARKAFHEALVANEKSSDDFLILSAFMQGTLTGDPEGGAHVAPIAAYDAKKRLVLVMDPDRDWYEPYWAPEDKVFEAVADPRADNEQPGYIHVTLR